VEKQWNRKLGEVIHLETVEISQTAVATEPEITACACGSGIPIQKIVIGGKEVTLVGLPLIFQQFYEAGKSPSEENLEELINTIKIYNPIPVEEEPAYRDGIQKTYSHYWFKEKDK
jgi:hypothetical protein